MSLLVRYSNLKNIYLNLFKPTVIPWDKIELNKYYKLEKMVVGADGFKVGDLIRVIEKTQTYLKMVKGSNPGGYWESLNAFSIHATIYYQGHLSFTKAVNYLRKKV